MQGSSGNTPRTLFAKLWDSHVVKPYDAQRDLLYIDRHLVYEVTSPQAFEGLRLRGLRPWRAETVLATADHNVPTTDRHLGVRDTLAKDQIQQLSENCREFGIREFPLGDVRQGIIHVIGPEQGATLPGMSIVAGDSHTSTHGAFAALAFGVGTSEVEHVLATQCLAVQRLKTMRITVTGSLSENVTAKDLILHIIRLLGVDGAIQHAIEFAGDAVSALSMEARMTLCNMAIEAGARVGLVAVDERTVDYLCGRPDAPSGEDWEHAVAYWRTLVSDPDSVFDKEISIRGEDVVSMVTWGTSPDMSVSLDDCVPGPDALQNATQRAGALRALQYMKLTPGTPLRQIMVDKVFIGSCTNARIEDLRAAAKVVAGKRVAASVRQALVVPGSGLVKKQGEAEGLDRVFREAGFEWREPGCSMCLGMNDDRLSEGERCVSTSNRNFEGRQGAGGMSHLVSPAVAAATAIAGRFAHPDEV